MLSRLTLSEEVGGRRRESQGKRKWEKGGGGGGEEGKGKVTGGSVREEKRKRTP